MTFFFLCTKCNNYCSYYEHTGSAHTTCYSSTCYPTFFYTQLWKVLVVYKFIATLWSIVINSSYQRKNLVLLILFFIIVNASISTFIPPTHDYDAELLWHARLGHVSFVKMKIISTIPLKSSTKQPLTFAICPMERQTIMPFPESTIRSNKMFLGHYNIPTYDSYTYSLNKLDDHTTQLLKCKNNALGLRLGVLNKMMQAKTLFLKSMGFRKMECYT